jgi:hypothetical protein
MTRILSRKKENNLKNTAVNALNYTGIVTLSRYNGTKKIKIAQTHNTGKNSLFNFLADCLVGDFDTAKLDRPTKIMLLKKHKVTDSDGESTTDAYESASGFIYLLNKPEKVYNQSGSTVRYSFAISRDILESTNFDNLGIGLYCNSATSLDIENFAAFCEIDISVNDVSDSALLVVDWELNIHNS